MTIFDLGKKLIRKTLQKRTATPFTYWHNGEKYPINATLTNPDATLLALTGAVTNAAEHFDLIVDPSELVVDGQQIEPRRGALITKLQLDDSYRRFSTVHRDREACFNWTDGQQMLMLVYLVEIKGVPAGSPPPEGPLVIDGGS